MPTARTWLSTCVVDEKIYAFGGHGTYPPWVLLKTGEVYDPVTDTWEILNDMPNKLQSFSASTVAGLIYLFGGLTSGGILSIVWQYNPILDTMIFITQMPLPRAGTHSSELNGAIYVTGGSPTMTIQPTTTVQAYTPPLVGVEDRGENNPEEFALHQNYPNPFNPTTTIKYQIPELSFVTLKIYDVLGSEIITLVNEEKSIGNYEVDWNASGLPSGIYFYKLQAGNFVETMKMLLLK
jgi:hypothetical protein